MAILDTVGWLAATTTIAVGGGVLIGAGRDEARGRLRQAARRARRGGFVAATGALGLTIVGIASLPRLTGAGSQLQTAAVLTTSLLLGVAAGFVGLLAGLSRKPRPSGSAALILVVLSLAAWVVAMLRAG
ncbi:MAG: hypothetical protein R3344_14275 [Acidobacteriota bacterium]|nr:hypothetical protein [Acidobacteriota bacterium]